MAGEQRDWRVEQITVGDRTIRITHIPTRTVAHGRDEADAWIAIAKALGRRLEGSVDSRLDFDFDGEAKRLAFSIAESPHPHRMGWHAAVLAETFRVIWNARGAADLARLEATLASRIGNGGVNLQTLDRELRKLDR